ncbi:hypothetical protein F4776DRAFT_630735 [Hypoxylon sp. NC0597]|nr:hypothetical protein F4776DRAFT_630735 [Hypoxylon sp. NC0597]
MIRPLSNSTAQTNNHNRHHGHDGNVNASREYRDLQENFASLSQQFDDVRNQLNQKSTELDALNQSHDDIQKYYDMLLRSFHIYRQQCETQFQLILSSQETAREEFKEKEARMLERMEDLYKALGTRRSIRHLEVTNYLEANTDFFYELLRVQVTKTDVMNEKLAAVTKENAELRARLESLGGGASA